MSCVFTGIGTVLTVGRYAIRFKTINELKADDYVHGLALLALVCYVSTYNVMLPLNSESLTAGAQEQPLDSDLKRYARLVVAVSAQFWVVIYLVKASFLLFYRLLFGVSQNFMKAWWAVNAFTTVTFFINFLAVFWSCGAPSHLFVIGTFTSGFHQVEEQA